MSAPAKKNKQPAAPAWAKSTAKKVRAAKLSTQDIHALVQSWLPSSTDSAAHICDSLKLTPPPSLHALARFYELSHPDRSDTGVYYTPPAAASLMAHAALTKWLTLQTGIAPEEVATLFTDHPVLTPQQRLALAHALCSVTILDPASGTGDLLLAALNAIWQTLSHLFDPPFTGSLIGVDIDPIALSIARARLTQYHPDLEPRLTLITGSGLAQPPSLTADVLLLNPPYVPAYSRRSRKAKVITPQETLFKTQGRINVFTQFIAAITTLTRPTGVACTLTPDTLAFADSYAVDREKLAARFPSQRWLLIEKPIFDASVQNVIGLFWADGPQSHAAQADHIPQAFHSPALSWIKASADTSSCGPIIFYKHPIEPLIQSTVANLSGPALSLVFDVKDGINPGPAHMREKLIARLAPKPRQPLSPILVGRDIAPWGFHISPPKLGIRYDPALISPDQKRAGTSLRNPIIFKSPKLVSRQTANMPIVGIDLDNSYHSLNSVHNIRAISPDHAPLLWGLMAYLNSPVIRLYYALSGGETRATLPQVRIAWLNRLPLPSGWPALFAVLTPLAQSLSEPDPAILTQIHEAICRHLALPDPEPVAQAYRLRFLK